MKELNRIKFFHLTCMLDLCLFFLFQYSRVEEKSVIKIFYDNAWGWKLISELSALRGGADIFLDWLCSHTKALSVLPRTHISK